MDDVTKGPQLDDQTERLFRQVHPSWIQEGRPTSQAFRPTPKDQGQLSLARGAKTSAADAYALYTVRMGLKSAGVWALRVGDFTAQNIAVFADPIDGPVPDPAHAVADFAELDDKQTRIRSQMLKARAEPVFVQKGSDDSSNP